LILDPQRCIRAAAVFLLRLPTYSEAIDESNPTKTRRDRHHQPVIEGTTMNRNHLLAAALALAVVGTSAIAQEATPDTWTQAAATKSVEQVRTELAQARKDGTIKAWSSGYIEKVPAVKSREQVRAEVAAARRNGELDSFGSEAFAFAPPAAPATVLARKQ
jgi:hypothetical protein